MLPIMAQPFLFVPPMHTHTDISHPRFDITEGNVSLHTLQQGLCAAIASRYDMGEARALSFLLLEDGFGVCRTDVFADKVKYFSSDECQRLLSILQQLLDGVPLQYALGEAQFCGRTFRVTPDTLIPRPETEELVRWCEEEIIGEKGFDVGQGGVEAEQGSGHLRQEPTTLRLLDVGTGSGCIAITLAAILPPSWKVKAWDISSGALAVARDNAMRHHVSVDFSLQDALCCENVCETYNVIVSNPPYICDSERQDMESHVLDHEPHTALFVPDADPLLFYRALAQLARRTLCPDGLLMVEINRAYAAETIALFQSQGLVDVRLRHDAFGNPRMVCARQREALSTHNGTTLHEIIN